MVSSLQDPNRLKLVYLIYYLDSEVRAQLIALMWVDQGNGSPRDFERLKLYAQKQSDVGDANYVFAKPLDKYLTKTKEQLLFLIIFYFMCGFVWLLFQ
jgi:hypothetical protein